MQDREFDKFLTAMAKQNFEAIHPTLVERIIQRCESSEERMRIGQMLGEILRAADLRRGRAYAKR